jgi:hypothetical protein
MVFTAWLWIRQLINYINCALGWMASYLIQRRILHVSTFTKMAKLSTTCQVLQQQWTTLNRNDHTASSAVVNKWISKTVKTQRILNPLKITLHSARTNLISILLIECHLTKTSALTQITWIICSATIVKLKRHSPDEPWRLHTTALHSLSQCILYKCWQ